MHEAAQAEFVQVGAWLRPAYYKQNTSDKQNCITQEIYAVRHAAGLLDVSTLGKIEVHGADAALFLERFYTGSFISMGVGKTRYALALDEAGVMMDDGVACKLAEDLFYVTASTANAATIYREMQRWQQLWQLEITLINVTSAYAAINLAGPAAKEILNTLTTTSLAEADFPVGDVRILELAGQLARVVRVGFVSNQAYELHIASAFAAELWNRLMQAGSSHGIRAFGTEAQRLLRLEMGHLITGHDTDGLTHPYEAGAEFAIKANKAYFIGQRSLQIINKKALKKKLVPFFLEHLGDSECPLECNLVIEQGEIAGRVTSIAFSPSLQRHIGFAYVPPYKAQVGDLFYIKTDSGAMVKAVVTTTPFISSANEKK